MIKKKVFIIILSGVLLGLLGAGGYFWYLNIQDKPTIANDPQQAVEKKSIEYSAWKDPLGVSFSYPAQATVDKHDEDKENYMHVEITSATHSGGLVLWAKDFPKGVTDLLTWGKKEMASSTGVMVDTTLGGVDAKKILVGTDKVRLAAIYDELLFEIEARLDTEGYWKEALETAISSYVFYPVKGSSPAATGSGGSGDVGGTVDEEEVLE